MVVVSGGVDWLVGVEGSDGGGSGGLVLVVVGIVV